MAGAPEFTARVLKRLKHRYGVPVKVYRRVSSETDICTGVQTVVVDTFTVNKAIVFPARESQEQFPAGFEFGGAYVQGAREQFMVDPDECLFVPDVGHWLVFAGARYDIEVVRKYGTALLISALQDLAHPTGPNVIAVDVETELELTPEAEEEFVAGP